MDNASQLDAYRERSERGLRDLLPPAGTRPVRLHEAMRYSLEAGGKRLRPVFVLAAADVFAGRHAPAPASTATDALPAAVAIECIHTYSLIHDDLPCMDDDDLRRGRPTAHKQFDEATALLAGDALLTYTFQLLGRHYAGVPALAAALTREIAEAAGSEHLIGGQMEDLLAEGKPGVTAGELEFIHLNKTAALLTAALAAGALCGGAAEDELLRVRTAGRDLGLAFQIVDDVLDATADSRTLGKTAGKDARADKTTYVKLHGLEQARRLAEEHTAKALAALAALPGDTGFLRWLAASLTSRKN